MCVCLCKNESRKCVSSRSPSVCASLSGRHEGHASWPQVESVWNAPDSSTLRNKPQLQGRRERDLHHPLKPHTPAHTSSMHCAFLTSDINLTHTHTHTQKHWVGKESYVRDEWDWIWSTLYDQSLFLCSLTQPSFTLTEISDVCYTLPTLCLCHACFL